MTPTEVMNDDIPLAAVFERPEVARSFDALLEALREIPDPRRMAGTRYGFDALLAMLVLGWCCGCRGIQHTLEFMAPRRALRARLGFSRPDMPAGSTYSRLLAAVPAAHFAEALQRWVGAIARERLAAATEAARAADAPESSADKAATAAVDGKTARAVGEHFVNVFLGDLGVVLASWPVEPGRNELSTLRQHLPGLLDAHPWLVCLTFDAGYGDRSLAEALADQDVQGLFQIKGNQPETLRRLERFFAPLRQSPPDASSSDKKGALS